MCIRDRVYLGVRMDPHTGDVCAGGGLVIQPLPGCPACNLDALQERADGIRALAGMLETIPLEKALQKLFQGMDWRLTESLTPAFRCDCSRPRLEQALISLGEAELTDMIETEHGAELTCHFCNKDVYKRQSTGSWAVTWMRKRMTSPMRRKMHSPGF